MKSVKRFYELVALLFGVFMFELWAEITFSDCKSIRFDVTDFSPFQMKCNFYEAVKMTLFQLQKKTLSMKLKSWRKTAIF